MYSKTFRQLSSISKRHALQAICPYFAMFPEEFVRENVEKYSEKGDWIFDPFCGRGTTILEALLLGRNAAGSDINPVAFCVSRAKADHPNLDAVQSQLVQLESQYMRIERNKWKQKRLALTPFFRRAFYPSTINELLFLRETLDWRNNHVERFIAALIIGSLHGEMDKSNAYFSNQMPRTICLKPDYSLRYWKAKGLYPKKKKVFEMLHQKAEYRLKGIAGCPTGSVTMSDSRIAASCFPRLQGKVRLVVTSPPYLNVTRYEEDQWLRLWFLGGDARPTYNNISKDDRHKGKDRYWGFLRESWAGIAPLMMKSSTIVVRIGAIGLLEDEITLQLKATMKDAFPNSKLVNKPMRSVIIGKQSSNFAPKSKGCLFEMDYIFSTN